MDFQLQYGGRFLWDFGRNYLYHKALYKQKLHSVEKYRIGEKVTKMETK